MNISTTRPYRIEMMNELLKEILILNSLNRDNDNIKHIEFTQSLISNIKERLEGENPLLNGLLNSYQKYAARLDPNEESFLELTNRKVEKYQRKVDTLSRLILMNN